MLGFRKFIIYGTIFLACSFLFILYILGTVHYVTTREENTCEMTYMFEYPQYVVCKKLIMKKLTLIMDNSFFFFVLYRE